MPSGHRLCGLICVLAMLPGVAVSADLPVLQLTVQPARLPNHDQYVANTLLRELQRQAVLIAARDELGIATRDMVLREPFAAHGIGGVTTVLCATRVERNRSAEILLSRFDGAQTKDPFSLADLPVDQPQNNLLQSVLFPISKNALVDYPEFVTHCEEASRTSYLKAIQAENFLGNFTPQPTRWADHDETAVAAADALLQLQHLDVFSQYLALRRLHDQMRIDGASTARLTALVRGYANLGQLTRNEWSQANKVYFARALLYAERLVVHENSTPDSLYARAYARAFAGLHAAALDDLAAAEKQQGTLPPWATLLKGLCLYDPQTLEQSFAFGSWRYRPLAAFLAAKVRQDAFPLSEQQEVLTRAVTQFPGLFALDPLGSGNLMDTTVLHVSDQMGDRLPVVLVDSLKNAGLPPAIQALVHPTDAGDKTYQQLRDLREALNNAAGKSPRDVGEPSYAVLADLIEQQEMVAIVHQATVTGVAGQNDVKALLVSAHPIVKAHPWGPLLEAIEVDNPSDGASVNPILAKVRDHDPGPWIADVADETYHMPTESNKYIKRWIEASNLSTDSLVEDYTLDSVTAKATRRGTEPALAQLRQTSPHSGLLLETWMHAYPMDSGQQHEKVYTNTLNLVENEFFNRPAVMLQACDWCDARGDFARSLKLLEKVDHVEPTDRTCDRLGLVNWQLGKHDDAIKDLIRGARQTEDSTEKATLYQRAGYFLISDHRYAEALTNVQLAAEAPTPRTWQLMARCYEAMGQLDDAAEALHQQAILDPSAYSQYYLWARRLNRADANDIQRQAIASYSQPTETFFTNFYVCMADNQEAQAFDLLRKNRDQMNDAYQFAQLVILAKKQNSKQAFNNNVNALRNRGGDHHEFGLEFRSLIQSLYLPDGIMIFDRWVARQLDDEDAMDWYSLAGRYLVAAGHVTEGKVYLTRAIRSIVRERENYYLAWRELKNLGEDPDKLAAPTTQATLR